MEKKTLYSKLNELKNTLENERKAASEKTYELEKEKMQLQMEKDTLNKSKKDIAERFSVLTNKFNVATKELESLRRPPTNLKNKDISKESIKDLMKNNILTKNSSNSSLTRFGSTKVILMTESREDDEFKDCLS